MSAAATDDPLDPTGIALRALLLYSLAEVQSGHATTIRFTAEGRSFSVSATVHPQLQRGGVALAPLQKWLLGVLAASPSLQLHFNGRLLHAPANDP